MKVAEYFGVGGPEVIKIAERPKPEPRNGELLVKVAAAGVNRPDILQRQDNHPPPPGASDIPGLEISGTVEYLGPSVYKFKVGDRVCGLVSGGEYAEYCIVHESIALAVPSGLSLIEAAAVPETFCTVWTNLFMDGALKSGESVLVHGGTSGIGTTAIQLAREFGAGPIITTVGSDSKAEACEKLGARAINYRTTDFVPAVKEITNNQGVNKTLDMVGGDYVNKNYECSAKFGYIIQIASLKGDAHVNPNLIMMKRLVHTGSTLRARTVEEKSKVISDLEKKVWPMMGTKIKPIIDSTFSLAEAKKAHERMDEDHTGKVVLVVDPEEK